MPNTAAANRLEIPPLLRAAFRVVRENPERYPTAARAADEAEALIASERAASGDPGPGRLTFGQEEWIGPAIRTHDAELASRLALAPRLDAERAQLLRLRALAGGPRSVFQARRESEAFGWAADAAELQRLVRRRYARALPRGGHAITPAGLRRLEELGEPR